MKDYSSEIAEYRLFDSLSDFLNNKIADTGPLKVKNDRVFVPEFKKRYITYIRSKRLGMGNEIKDNGSILVFHDSSAYSDTSPEFFQSIMFRKRGIYIKEQSLNIYRDTKRFIVGYHFPHWLSFPYMEKEFNHNRSIDVMYAGKKRKQRDGIYDDITRSAKNLGLNCFFGQSKKQIDRKTGIPPEGLLTPKNYVQKLKHSKIAYSLLGTGYRSHRDWEALLCGSFLINDARSVNCCQLRGLIEHKHFVTLQHDNVEQQMKYWIEHEDERMAIAKSGFEAAWAIWEDATDHWYPARKLACSKIESNDWI